MWLISSLNSHQRPRSSLLVKIASRPHDGGSAERGAIYRGVGLRDISSVSVRRRRRRSQSKPERKGMASSMLSSATVAPRTTVGQVTLVAPFTGLKSSAAFPTKKTTSDITSITSNGGRTQCMQVWPPRGLKKFETLSYLPDLTVEQLSKEVDYLIKNGWIPCLEFTIDDPFVSRDNNKSPGYYDGRYWTMWKLPMYGCTDSSQVIKEVGECVKEYPDAHVRIIGFDNTRQVQCISFIAAKPPST